MGLPRAENLAASELSNFALHCHKVMRKSPFSDEKKQYRKLTRGQCRVARIQSSSATVYGDL